MHLHAYVTVVRVVLCVRQEYDCLMVDEINDVRIIGVITAVAMMAIALAGLTWESKVTRPKPVAFRFWFNWSDFSGDYSKLGPISQSSLKK